MQAMMGSFLLLYTTDDITYVILNSMALFFIIDLDEYMLDQGDYQLIDAWYEDVYNEDDMENRRYKEMHPVLLFIVKVMTTIHFTFTGLGIIFAVIAPIWIFVCH